MHHVVADTCLAYIGLGSNIGEPGTPPKDLINRAYQSIAEQLDGQARCSNLYSSSPMGPQDQPDYVNAVVSINTTLAPLALLDALQAIEQNFGRVRGRRWGARTLDLDLLVMLDPSGNSITHADERLILPHYGLFARDFVVVPLLELSPNLRLQGRSLARLKVAVSHNLVPI